MMRALMLLAALVLGSCSSTDRQWADVATMVQHTQANQ